MELSISLEAALAQGVILIGPGAQVAASVRVVPREDDGRDFGPIEIGEGTIVRDCVILSTGVRIRRRVLVGHHCVLRRCVVIGDDSVLSHLISIQHDVAIGSRVRISSLTHLTGGSIVEDDVQIGSGVTTVDDNNMEWPHPRELRGPVFRRGCRIGSGATILAGVEIGRNTLIGAGSVVTRPMPDDVIAFGNPAYVQRDSPKEEWLRMPEPG